MIFEFIHVLIRLLKTSDPSKKFRIELDLMFWGTEHSRCIRKFFQRCIFYKYNCEVSHQAITHPTVVFGHPSGLIIGSNAIVGENSIVGANAIVTKNVAENMVAIGANKFQCRKC